MSIDSNNSSGASTPIWELHGADQAQLENPSTWGRNRIGNGFVLVDALRAVRRRKVLAGGSVAASLLLAAAWMLTTPVYFTATQPLLFSQALDDEARVAVLAAATGAEAQERAAASVGLSMGDIRVTAAMFGARSLAVSADSSDPNAASTATEAAVEVLRLRTPVGFRPQSPVSAEPWHWSRMRAFLLAASALAGLFGACAVAWLLERRARLITSAAELFELTSLPVLTLSPTSSADEETSSHVS